VEPRVAIVTGASKRVGRVLAEGLLADGWTVVAHVRRAEDDVPTGAIRAAADLAGGKEAADAIIAACPEPPRLLVNNASRFASDRLADFTPDALAAHMTVNVAAPALLSAAFARAAAAGDRLVVNILDAKLAAPNPDFAEQGIRVNAIAPALMLLSEGQSAGNFAATHAFNPLRRGVEPSDVLRAVRFLVDSPVITGETLTLDGGQRFWRLPRDVQFLQTDGP